MSQYMVHYLILAPPPPLCSFIIARPSGMQQTAKCNNLTTPKPDVGVRDSAESKMHLAHHSTFSPLLCEEEMVTVQKYNSLGPGGGVPY